MNKPEQARDMKRELLFDLWDRRVITDPNQLLKSQGVKMFRKEIVKSFFDDCYSVTTIANNMKINVEYVEDMLREYCKKTGSRPCRPAKKAKLKRKRK